MRKRPLRKKLFNVYMEKGMNNSNITFVLIALVAAAIAYVGAFLGEPILVKWWGGQATGVVAGVVVLISAFTPLYIKLRSLENQLNEDGFIQLLELHAQSINYKLMYIAEQQVKQQEINKKQEIDIESLIAAVTSVIRDARNDLKLFKVHGVDSVVGFLNNRLPIEEIEKIVREEAIPRLESRASPSEKIKSIHVLLRSIQSRISYARVVSRTPESYLVRLPYEESLKIHEVRHMESPAPHAQQPTTSASWVSTKRQSDISKSAALAIPEP